MADRVKGLLPGAAAGGAAALHEGLSAAASFDIGGATEMITAPLKVAAAESWLRAQLEEHMQNIGPIKSVKISAEGAMQVEFTIPKLM